MQQPWSPAPPPPSTPPPPPSGVFERLMQSITAMSALGILFLMLFPLLACIGLFVLCVLTGKGMGS